MNSFVKRTAGGGTNASTSTPQAKSTGVLGQSRNTSAKHPALAPPMQKKFQQSSPSISLHSPDVVKDVKNDSHSTGTHEQNVKPNESKGKVPQLPVNKKKGPNDKNSSGTTGALANMWGQASAKSKAENFAANSKDSLPNSTGLFLYFHMLRNDFFYFFKYQFQAAVLHI